jgi:hypothetical protein
MTEREWMRLTRDFSEGGLKVGNPPEGTQELHVLLGQANGIPSNETLEWLAGFYQMLPLDPSRTSCSTGAEALFRKLATPSESEEPWMPLGNLGPLMISVHYNPACADFWDIPVEFLIPVLIPRAKYEALRRDILERLEFKPLEPREPTRLKNPLPRGQGLRKVLDWILDEYPFEDAESRERLGRERDAIEDGRCHGPAQTSARHGGGYLSSLHRRSGVQCRIRSAAADFPRVPDGKACGLSHALRKKSCPPALGGTEQLRLRGRVALQRQ